MLQITFLPKLLVTFSIKISKMLEFANMLFKKVTYK